MNKEGKTAPAIENPKYLWLSGQLLPWEQANVHITAIQWTSISAVFEGIRAYWNEANETLHIFHLDAHLDRLQTSMRLMRMKPSFTNPDLKAAIIELLRQNELRQDAYISPFAFFGGGIAGYRAAGDLTPEILITTRPIDSFLGTERGSRCCVSTWVRISDNVMPPRAKCIANYQNSRMVSTEAAINGYDDGIILNLQGKVAEGAYACIFLVRNGVAITPPVTAGILESITRESVITLLRDEVGMPVVEREVDRTELYVADEAFFCGTYAEIKPIVSVDQFNVGSGAMGPITTELERLFHTIVRGTDRRYPEWRTPVSMAKVKS